MTSTEKLIVTTDSANVAATAPTVTPAKPTTALDAPVVLGKLAPKAAAKPVAKKSALIAKTPAKTRLKAPTKAPVKAVVKVAVKPSAKTPVKPLAKTTIKAPAKPLTKPVTKPKVEKPVKLKKPKLVRDSFTIPKAEYTVLDDLKQRTTKLAHLVKKSELIRAGIKALAAMSDAAFLAALKAVPMIKTGRPTKAKTD